MKKSGPPRFVLRFLKWFCKPEYHADIEGDLLEFYERRVAETGRTRQTAIVQRCDVSLQARYHPIGYYTTDNQQ
jgi:hypothetical protein